MQYYETDKEKFPKEEFLYQDYSGLAVVVSKRTYKRPTVSAIRQ